MASFEDFSFIFCLAFEKALLYFDSHELPLNWNREELLGSDNDDGDEGEDVSLSFQLFQSANESLQYLIPSFQKLHHILEYIVM